MPSLWVILSEFPWPTTIQIQTLRRRKVVWFGYPKVKTAWSQLDSFYHNTSVWLTDGHKTDGRPMAIERCIASAKLHCTKIFIDSRRLTADITCNIQLDCGAITAMLTYRLQLLVRSLTHVKRTAIHLAPVGRIAIKLSVRQTLGRQRSSGCRVWHQATAAASRPRSQPSRRRRWRSRAPSTFSPARRRRGWTELDEKIT